jgi:Icc-related predicted phosphoesterase
MRLQILSDLHFEFHYDGGRSFVESLNPKGIDVLVLAGDLTVARDLKSALALMCKRFSGTTVVYVHGNHEFYRSNHKFVTDETKKAQAANANLVWLDCSEVKLHGVNFLGAPLWFPYDVDNERIKHGLNDFSSIEDFESWVYVENARAVAYFKERIRPGDVVVSHHLPMQRCVHPKYTNHPLNPFFVCDMTEVVLERQPRLWICGHSHASARVEIGETTLLCNPFGYAGEALNPEFDSRLVIDV